MRLGRIIILGLILLIPLTAFTQTWKLSREDYSYGIGFSNYFGDIGGASSEDAMSILDLDIVNTRIVLSAGYRYRIYERIAVKAGLNYAYLYGADVNSKNEGRGYSFKANMFELNGHVEYHITKERQMRTYSSMSMRGKLRKLNVGFNLYVFAGVGAAYVKPKPGSGNFDGRYTGDKNFAITFPVGIGVKYPLTPKSNIGLEFSRRFVMSDYIDGFSPDQSDKMDAYYFTVISVSTKLKRRTKRSREFRF